MAENGSRDDRPVDGSAPARDDDSGSAVPPPPPAPPGAGPDPWAPGGIRDDRGSAQPPPGYPAPQGNGPPSPYGATPTGYAEGGAPPPRNGLGVAALVLGVTGILFAVLFFPLGFVLAVAGIGLGIAGVKRAGRGLATNRGMALSGTVLSLIALLICITWGVVIGLVINKAKDCADPGLSQSEQRQCLEDKLRN